MAKVMVIGCGNVGSVGLRKMVKWPNVFSEITVATRTEEKAFKVKKAVWEKYPGVFNICQVDVSKRGELENAILKFKPNLLIHWGHPYDNLTIMKACLDLGVPYIDTACYENPNQYGFSHQRQWEMNSYFAEKKLLALLGCGFDPGVTNIFSAYARDYLFEKVQTIDILDCNAGTKNVRFAPNFDPELNIRELIMPVKYWKKGKWQERGRIFDDDAAHFKFNFPKAGIATPYLMYHEEMESIVKHMPHLNQIRFWMTFSKDYLTHLRVLNTVGLTRIDPVEYEGKAVVPVKFLDVLLPKGEDFNSSYRGKTCIGCIISGVTDRKKSTVFIYQVCDHRQAYLETGGNAIGYTTAIPTVTAAKLILEGRWVNEISGVRNVEDQMFNPKIFLDELTIMGLPWTIKNLEDLPAPLKKSY
jgi:saccharopine dehydrogenase (NAD+, L-lysine-forming)